MQPNTKTQKHFFLNTVKRTMSYFAVSLLTIILFFSCTIQPDVSIVFTITKEGREGQEIDTKSSPLIYNNDYLLTVGTINDVAITTTDYHITYEPAGAFTKLSQTSNSLSFTVNAGHTTATFTATHKKDTTITETLIVNLGNSDTPTTDFASDIQGTTVPDLADLINTSQLTRNVLGPLFSHLGDGAGTPLEKRYVTESGGGSYNGTSWANAWAATNLRSGINAIGDASASKVYLIMVAGGTYRPTTTTTRTISFSMTNHVAIMGGFEAGGGWARTGTTIFSGDIGTVGNDGDNSYNVFYHNNVPLERAHLYGVTITGGNANGSSDAQNSGGGMHNSSASPVLTSVVFSDNKATGGSFGGGGMYNKDSSPILNNTRFANNTASDGGVSAPANGRGGGMYNDNSYPVLNGAFFTDNNARLGGGMYNQNASPIITTAVFNSNVATVQGGGIYNNISSFMIIGAVFRGNHDDDGAAIVINGTNSTVPTIVNTIFSDNTKTSATSRARGPDIAVDGSRNIAIAGTVLGIGRAQPIDAIVKLGATLITYHSLTNEPVNFGANATFGEITYPTIIAGSSAINLGLHVKRDDSSRVTYYFSENKNTWYSGFSATGGWGSTATPPITAVDLTFTDIVGNERNARPDAGVYELP